VLQTLSERVAADDPPVREYTVALVEGVCAHRARIDDLISTYAVDWPMDRMPAVDRNVLRVGLYELLWAEDVPDAVAVSEAVDLVTELSTDASPAFVNGLLGRIVQLKPTLSA
jgi:N utilization substance protein B